MNAFKSNSRIIENIKYYEISTVYECIEKKIDNYKLSNLNDLFGIKLIFLLSEFNIANF